MKAKAFYRAIDARRFMPTAATVGPWDERLQHGSPPAALLAHCIDSNLPRADVRVAHLNFDFFGTVPVGEMEVDVEIIRPGTRVECVRSRIQANGRTVMELSAWRMAFAAGRVPATERVEQLPMLPHAPLSQLVFGREPWFGYGLATEWRFVEGDFSSLGAATAWARPLVPLIENVPLSPLSRLLLVVDAANGISAELPLEKYTFVPVRLSIGLQRHPAIEWIGIKAQTTIVADGIGLTHASLFDENGFLGTAQQSLFVAPR